MGNENYRRALAIQRTNEERLAKLLPNIPARSGIYIFYRTENNIKYAYVGQAKNLKSRTAQHLTGYQHIDLSIKKHGLYDVDKNQNGYKLKIYEFPVEQLDEKEREYIQKAVKHGYQLRNKTVGGQDVGKSGIADNERQTKGYQEGLHNGFNNCLKLVKEFFDKYLTFDMKEPKYNKQGKIYHTKKRKMEEFAELLQKGGK